MWHTERGDRVLRGAEAKVFAESLLDLIDNELSEDSGFQVGIPGFDSLMYPQKIAVLHQVAQALFQPEIPMPELTAVLEGAVAAVIQNAYWLIEEEVEVAPSDDTTLRKLVSRACKDLDMEEVPSPSSDDIQEWAFCAECLHDAILWDSDYLGEANFIDRPPDHAKAMKEEMGISDDYFLALAPEPAPNQLPSLLADLETLCKAIAKLGRPKRAASQRPPNDHHGRRAR